MKAVQFVCLYLLSQNLKYKYNLIVLSGSVTLPMLCMGHKHSGKGVKMFLETLESLFCLQDSCIGFFIPDAITFKIPRAILPHMVRVVLRFGWVKIC